MKCLVDTSVMNALLYYTEHNFEPSPAGDITVSDREVEGISKIHFGKVLDAMKAGGAKGKLMVVSHSDPDGLMMPLAADSGVSATFSVFAKLEETVTAIAEQDRARTAQAGNRAALWRAWFKKYSPETTFESGWETVPGWETEILNLYRGWYDVQATDVFKFPDTPKFTAFLRLWQAVKKAGFGRLEFRACDIGTNPDQLEAMAKSLNAKIMVAPRVARTFYGKMSLNIVKQTEYDEIYKKGVSEVRKFDDVGVMLRIVGEDGKAYTTTQGAGIKFIDKYIHKNPKAKEVPFVIGGLEPRSGHTVPKKPQVFPAETEYKTFLVQVP